MKKVYLIALLAVVLTGCSSVYKGVITRNYDTMGKAIDYIEGRKAPTKDIMVLELKNAQMACKEAVKDKYGKTPDIDNYMQTNVSPEDPGLFKVPTGSPLAYIQSLYAQKQAIETEIQLYRLASEGKPLTLNLSLENE